MKAQTIAVALIVLLMIAALGIMVKGFTKENYLRIFLALGGFAGFAWLLFTTVKPSVKQKNTQSNDGEAEDDL